MDPAVQRATCAAVLDVLDHTLDLTDVQRNRRSRLGMRASEQLFALGWRRPARAAQHSQPPTPPSAVDAVLAWCARELDRVGVP